MSQTTRWMFKSPAAWSVGVFGSLTVLMAWFTLIAPKAVLGVLGFQQSDNIGAVYLLVVASNAVGFFYVLAAYNNADWFFEWSVIIRAINFLLFTIFVLTALAPAGVLLVALWEGLGSVWTAVSMRRYADAGLEDGSRGASAPSRH